MKNMTYGYYLSIDKRILSAMVIRKVRDVITSYYQRILIYTSEKRSLKNGPIEYNMVLRYVITILCISYVVESHRSYTYRLQSIFEYNKST